MASNKSALRSAPQNYPSSVLRNSPSFRHEREPRSAPKFQPVHWQQQCFSKLWLTVVFMLSSETEIPSPKQPAFLFRKSDKFPDLALEVEDGQCCK